MEYNEKEGIIAGKISKGQIMQGLGELWKKSQASLLGWRGARTEARRQIRRPLQTSK